MISTHWFVKRLKQYGQKLALVYNDNQYSYTNLYEKTLELSNDISLVIEPKSVVAICSDYNFNSIAAFIALLQNQCIIVPITSTVDEEVSERLREGFADFIISFNEKDETIITPTTDQPEEKHNFINTLNRNDESGLILFSSGSTGKPKAMIHNLEKLCLSYKDRKSKSIRMMVFLMFDHIGGLNTMLSALAMGSSMVIPSDREPQLVGYLIEKYKVQILPASPTFLNMILMGNIPEQYNFSSLRMVTYGTETMPEGLLMRLKEAFPKVKFLQTFGTSETGIAQTISKSSKSLFMKFEDPNLEYKVVNGELWLKSDTQVTGYLNASMDSFTDDGWFKTGDLVEQDEDGYIKIIGRSKEVINVGGEKVLPAEIEGVILQIPEIEDCTVYGEKNSITGQNVAVNVIADEGLTRRHCKKLIRNFCKDKLDGYKIPVTVNIVSNNKVSDRFKKVRT